MPFNYVKKMRSKDYIELDTIMAEDNDPRMIDATHQSYRTEMGLPWVLPIVKEIEIKMSNADPFIPETLPIFGARSFRNAVTELVLGKQNPRIINNQVLTLQTFSSIGASRIIGELAWRYLKMKQVYFPDSSWEGLQAAFEASGFPKPKTYRYYDHAKQELDINGMLQDLRAIPPDSLVLFYCCCHNPTGCDPTEKQWKIIAECIGMGVFPIIDLSYQGLASGDPDTDAFPIRLFARLGLEMAVTVSFAHNFILYNDKIGALMFFTRHQEDIAPLKSHLAVLVNSLFGTPPFYGAQIITTILKSRKFYDEWLECILKIKKQVQASRHNFVEALNRFRVPGNWDYITKGNGLSTFINLTDRQMQHLILYHHVYIRPNGSLNVGCLTEDLIDYVAEAIGDCIREFPTAERLREWDV